MEQGRDAVGGTGPHVRDVRVVLVEHDMVAAQRGRDPVDAERSVEAAGRGDGDDRYAVLGACPGDPVKDRPGFLEGEGFRSVGETALAVRSGTRYASAKTLRRRGCRAAS